MSSDQRSDEETPIKKKGKHKKDKRKWTASNTSSMAAAQCVQQLILLQSAWDTEDIDKWEVKPWSPDECKKPFLEESSVATLFPKYRERYLKEVWPLVTKALEKHVGHVAGSSYANAYRML